MKPLQNLLHAIRQNHSTGSDRFFLFLRQNRFRLIIGAETAALLLLLSGWAIRQTSASPAGLFSHILFFLGEETENGSTEKQDFIKWVDFDVTSEAMTQAFRYDVDTCQQEIHLNWVDLLAYLGARYGGDFSHYKAADMDAFAEQLKNGQSLDELTRELPHFSYYQKAYGAVLNGMVGYYEIQIPESQAPDFALPDAQVAESEPNAGSADTQAAKSEPDADGANAQVDESKPGTDGANAQADESKPDADGTNSQAAGDGNDGTDAQILTPAGERKVWVTKYGLKAFHPLAKNFPYSHYDDFGVARSYGYRRQHLGHDMMGQVGTPVIAVESGYVEALGWNQYGGWRLGIRSFDGQRYYYYAHLRKDYPYQSCLKEGSLVTAGDVIGYLGRTGYSATENTNNIDEPHLHFGLQLIFDESQKEGNNEIWIDCYELNKFLSINRSEAVKITGTKEWNRVYEMKDPAVAQAQEAPNHSATAHE